MLGEHPERKLQTRLWWLKAAKNRRSINCYISEMTEDIHIVEMAYGLSISTNFHDLE